MGRRLRLVELSLYVAPKSYRDHFSDEIQDVLEQSGRCASFGSACGEAWALLRHTCRLRLRASVLTHEWSLALVATLVALLALLAGRAPVALIDLALDAHWTAFGSPGDPYVEPTFPTYLFWLLSFGLLAKGRLGWAAIAAWSAFAWSAGVLAVRLATDASAQIETEPFASIPLISEFTLGVATATLLVHRSTAVKASAILAKGVIPIAFIVIWVLDATVSFVTKDAVPLSIPMSAVGISMIAAAIWYGLPLRAALLVVIAFAVIPISRLSESLPLAGSSRVESLASVAAATLLFGGAALFALLGVERQIARLPRTVAR